MHDIEDPALTAVPQAGFGWGAACSSVATDHGTSLMLDRATGALVHGDPERTGPGLADLALFIPPHCRDVGVLFAVAPPHNLSIFRLSWHDGERCALVEPVERVVLTALPAAPDAAFGAIVRDRLLALTWETFRRTRMSDAWASQAIAAPVAAMFQSLSVLQGSFWTVDTAVRIAAGNPPYAQAIVQAICNDLDEAELAELGSKILSGCDMLRAFFAKRDPRDVWQGDPFIAHRAWLDGGRPPHAPVRAIGPELDILETDNPVDDRERLGKRLLSAARRRIAPRRGVCIVAAARNEGPYLLEWLAYHKAIGVEHAFIYANSNDDGSDELLEALHRAGEITLIRNEVGPACRPQLKAYQHALSMLPDTLDFRWTLTIDLDEFVVLDPGFEGIASFVRSQELRPVDAIALNWVMFGSSRNARWSEGRITGRFLQSLGTDWHIKSGLRTNRFAHAHAHFPVTPSFRPAITRNERGELYEHHPNGFPFALRPTATLAWVNHYFFKSADEFLWKNCRNRGDQAFVGDAINWAMLSDDWIGNFLEQYNAQDIEVDARITAYDPAVTRELDRLSRSGAVADIDRAVKRVAAERMERVRQEFLAHVRGSGTERQIAFAALLQQS